MTDRPIIFSAGMVLALLAGRKTMTRRIIKLPTKGEYVRPDMGGWAPTTVGGGNSFVIRRDGTREPAPELIAIWNQTTGTCVAARYQVGDRLYVRENLIYDWTENCWRYRADNALVIGPALPRPTPTRWPLGVCNSIHLPRDLSRITLIVNGVKIERLQDISDEDALAEGIEGTEFWREDHPPSICFSVLWNALHGADAWHKNPWVVAPSFRVEKINIDHLQQVAA